jgi:rhamnulokinase
MKTPGAWAAVDLGASGGRVLVGRMAGEHLDLELVHRFTYAARMRHGRLRWDITALFDGVRAGLGRAGARAAQWGTNIESIGVDGWGVDYGWLDAHGDLCAEPVCYRDARTHGALERLSSRVSREEIYRRTGIQFLPINTLVQLFAETELGERPPNAARLLMVPDLVQRELCGAHSGEVTNASTTQMLDARTRTWDTELCTAAGILPTALPELVQPGAVLGMLRGALDGETALAGLAGARIVAPATHDTASAVIGTPLESGWAFVSSGTWSLVGVERAAPVLSREACAANITNEAGVANTTRVLKNVMGLWILEGCRAAWARAGAPLELARIGAEVGEAQPDERCIDPDDLRFLDPPDMVVAVRAFLRETGQRDTQDPIELARIVLRSLALRYAEVVRTLERIGGAPIVGLHVVGGGSRNEVLNQMAADASELTVRAGPEEATALGNLLVQACAAGALPDVATARRFVARALPARSFEPRPSSHWARAAERLRSIAQRR